MKKRNKQHELKGDVVIATQKGLGHVQNFYKIFFLIKIWGYASTIGTNNLVGIGAFFNSVDRCFFCADTIQYGIYYLIACNKKRNYPTKQ